MPGKLSFKQCVSKTEHRSHPPSRYGSSRNGVFKDYNYLHLVSSAEGEQEPYLTDDRTPALYLLVADGGSTGRLVMAHWRSPVWRAIIWQELCRRNDTRVLIRIWGGHCHVAVGLAVSDLQPYH
jgi:hypothetical protein